MKDFFFKDYEFCFNTTLSGPHNFNSLLQSVIPIISFYLGKIPLISTATIPLLQVLYKIRQY